LKRADKGSREGTVYVFTKCFDTANQATPPFKPETLQTLDSQAPTEIILEVDTNAQPYWQALAAHLCISIVPEED